MRPWTQPVCCTHGDLHAAVRPVEVDDRQARGRHRIDGAPQKRPVGLAFELGILHLELIPNAPRNPGKELAVGDRGCDIEGREKPMAERTAKASVERVLVGQLRRTARGQAHVAFGHRHPTLLRPRAFGSCPAPLECPPYVFGVDPRDRPRLENGLIFRQPAHTGRAPRGAPRMASIEHQAHEGPFRRETIEEHRDLEVPNVIRLGMADIARHQALIEAARPFEVGSRGRDAGTVTRIMDEHLFTGDGGGDQMVKRAKEATVGRLTASRRRRAGDQALDVRRRHLVSPTQQLRHRFGITRRAAQRRKAGRIEVVVDADDQRAHGCGTRGHGSAGTGALVLGSRRTAGSPSRIQPRASRAAVHKRAISSSASELRASRARSIAITNAMANSQCRWPKHSSAQPTRRPSSIAPKAPVNVCVCARWVSDQRNE